MRHRAAVALTLLSVARDMVAPRVRSHEAPPAATRDQVLLLLGAVATL